MPLINSEFLVTLLWLNVLGGGVLLSNLEELSLESTRSDGLKEGYCQLNYTCLNRLKRSFTPKSYTTVKFGFLTVQMVDVYGLKPTILFGNLVIL